MVLRAADAILDRQVLHRLHVKRDSLDIGEPGLEVVNHFLGTRAAFGKRLQIDQHAAAVQRRVGAVDADERGKTFHRGILQDDTCEGLLALGHRGERYGLRRLGDALDGASILNWKESLGDENIKNNGEHQRDDRHDERRSLPVQYPVEHAAVTRDDAVEYLPALPVELVLLLFPGVTEEFGAHHRRQRQRYNRRNQDRDGERDRELAKQPADDVAHEQQRNQHSDERDGQRNDGESDLLRALQRRGQRLLTGLDIAGDIFDHHDRVIDHEAGRDRQRHQRQVIDRKTGEVHHAKCSYQRQRHCHARNDGRRQAAQEQEDDHDHQCDGQEKLELHIVHRSSYGDGAVGEHGDVDRGGQRRLQLRQ